MIDISSYVKLDENSREIIRESIPELAVLPEEIREKIIFNIISQVVPVTEQVVRAAEIFPNEEDNKISVICLLQILANAFNELQKQMVNVEVAKIIVKDIQNGNA